MRAASRRPQIMISMILMAFPENSSYSLCIFIQNSMGEKRGETGYIFIHKKMLLKFPFSAFTLSKLNATIFFLLNSST